MPAVLCILICAAALFFLPVFLVYLRAFYSPIGKKQSDIFSVPLNEQYAPYRETMFRLIRDLDSRPFEEVFITSHDGLRLRGRYYHHADGAPLDIAFHGYRGTAVRDMCGGFQVSLHAGHNVLLVDQRANGKSQGHCISFGINERQDCRAWVNYARTRFGDSLPIMLYGVSMGATTVLMASALDLGGNVRGIIADCPFSSPKEIIKKVCRDMHLPPIIAWPLIELAAKLIGRFDINAATAADAVRTSSIPTLILHGADDRFVPPEMSLVIAEARPDIERHSFPNAGHGISGIVHMDRYNEIVLHFIRRCCP